MLSKRANSEEFNKIEKIKVDSPEKFEQILSNFYYRAKMFSYKVAEELKSYDKNNLENAFKQFQEKRGPESEIEYAF